MFNEIYGVILKGVLIILSGVLAVIVTTFIDYLGKKRKEIIIRIGKERYNENYRIGKMIYYAVEQKFKNTAGKAEEKREEFDKLILEKIPLLTEKDIELLRESIVGEINNSIKENDLFNEA
ncbi:hypothetical protein [Oceanirhabdus sp. W0125-5]|uniref:hypothetical protein n=1 Tax=Oceanirhabdus sp. W0125-5 TaxID=2999116 RepID=UPI0022F31B92|nr:hypothetical protein [Oceanirhabdus sp. W0125-5]WBW96038.1 hypothetical protein OW730_20440 [Oceanirhabdus sp. W0125-5]